MKNLFIHFALIALVLLFSWSCSGDNNPVNPFPELPSADDSNIPDSVKSLYRKDAARLSVRYLYSIKSPDTSSIVIPHDLVNLFYDGFIYIYNSESEKAEYVTKTNPVHTFPYPALNYLIVKIDTSYSWTKAWQNENIMTDNSEINDLIIPYNFRVDQRSKFSNWIALEADSSINLFALCEKLEEIPGIIYAEPNGAIGDGNNIEIVINTEDNSIQYIFSVGWGDCPAGCISRHYWKFIVKTTGQVQFINEYGSPL